MAGVARLGEHQPGRRRDHQAGGLERLRVSVDVGAGALDRDLVQDRERLGADFGRRWQPLGGDEALAHEEDGAEHLLRRPAGERGVRVACQVAELVEAGGDHLVPHAGRPRVGHHHVARVDLDAVGDALVDRLVADALVEAEHGLVAAVRDARHLGLVEPPHLGDRRVPAVAGVHDRAAEVLEVVGRLRERRGDVVDRDRDVLVGAEEHRLGHAVGQVVDDRRPLVAGLVEEVVAHEQEAAVGQRVRARVAQPGAAVVVQQEAAQLGRRVEPAEGR